MTSPHIQGGPRKGGTGQTIAHTLVDRKQWAEIRIYKERAEIDLGSGRWRQKEVGSMEQENLALEA